MADAKTFAKGYLFGAPVKDLGWFASLIMGLASGMVAFFLTTFLGIAFVLFWNAAGHHADYTVTYRLIGLPIGVLVALLSLTYLGTFWVKRIARRS